MTKCKGDEREEKDRVVVEKRVKDRGREDSGYRK